MPPKTQDEIAALRLQQAEAQGIPLRRAEAAEKEAKQAKQPKKRTPTKPRSGGVAAGEEWTEKATDSPCTPCRKAKAICRYYMSGRSAACVRCQEKKVKCEGGNLPVGVRVKKRKTHDVVDSDLEDETPTPKKKKVEETPKAGPSKGKERAHPELEPEPEVEKVQLKKIVVVSRDLFLWVLQLGYSTGRHNPYGFARGCDTGTGPGHGLGAPPVSGKSDRVALQHSSWQHGMASRKRAGTTTATSSPPKKRSNRGADGASAPDAGSNENVAKKSKGKKGKKSSGREKKAVDDPTLEDDGIEIVEGGGRKKKKTTVEEVEDEGDGSQQKDAALIDEEERLRKMMDKWNSVMYAFYKPPVIEYIQ
ncbi:hypothetical protein K466DRAFT_571083, partial [Polyporus arcularius HHB13444]